MKGNRKCRKSIYNKGNTHRARAADKKLHAEGRVHTKRVPQAKNSVPKAANMKGNTIIGGGTLEIVLLEAKKCVLQAENCVPKAAYRTSFYSRKKHAAGRKLRAEGRVHTKRVPQAENGVPKAAYTQK